jgi:hypothetical protein
MDIESFALDLHHCFSHIFLFPFFLPAVVDLLLTRSLVYQMAALSSSLALAGVSFLGTVAAVVSLSWLVPWLLAQLGPRLRLRRVDLLGDLRGAWRPFASMRAIRHEEVVCQARPNQTSSRCNSRRDWRSAVQCRPLSTQGP